MHTLTITIGRNAGSVELVDEKWSSFKSEVVGLIFKHFGTHVALEQHEGVGYWEGKQETSFKVTALSTYEFSDGRTYDLKQGLRKLCPTYSQDAIAITRGESELVNR